MTAVVNCNECGRDLTVDKWLRCVYCGQRPPDADLSPPPRVLFTKSSVRRARVEAGLPPDRPDTFEQQPGGLFADDPLGASAKQSANEPKRSLSDPTCTGCGKKLAVNWAYRCIYCGTKADPAKVLAANAIQWGKSAARRMSAPAPSAAPSAAATGKGPVCKGCGRPLVTTLDNKCVYCFTKVSAWRAGKGKTVYTKRGARKARQAANAEDELRLMGGSGAPAAGAPGSTGGMTWEQAEVLAQNWMRRNGYRDAKVTPPGADGGIDVISKKAVAQVKHHAKPVGLPEMQRLYGIAQSTGKQALFFSTAGFTPKAIAWGRTHGIAMYQMPNMTRIR